MTKFFITLLSVFILAACQFDGSAKIIPDDPAAEVTCEVDRDCQKVGFACNVYSCTDANACEVDAILCEEDEVCRKDGCEAAPVTECEEHSECVPDEGCEAAYCTEDGTCESYSCGPSLGCTSDGDCNSDSFCNDSNNCEALPACGPQVGCQDHDWSCYDSACDNGTCAFVSTCASGESCTATGCVADTVEAGDLEVHCENTDGIRATFSGDISTGIVVTDGDLPGTPGKVSIAGNVGFGSGTYWPSTSSGIDSSLPTCDVAVDNDGKWSCTSFLGFGDSVQEFQFVVANSANTDLRYFDLSKWNVTGSCAKDSSGGLLCSCLSSPCTCP